jgi:hypothetical protein
MKQSGHIWNQTLNTQMIEWGFACLSCKSCIYFCKTNSGIVIAAVYVDNYLAITDSKDENECFKDQMCRVWTISNLGIACLIMGIAVTWDRATCTVALSQTALIDKIFGQRDAHPMSAPLKPGSKLWCANHDSITPDE